MGFFDDPYDENGMSPENNANKPWDDNEDEAHLHGGKPWDANDDEANCWDPESGGTQEPLTPIQERFMNLFNRLQALKNPAVPTPEPRPDPNEQLDKLVEEADNQEAFFKLITKDI